MTLDRTQRITRGLKRPAIYAITALTLFGGILAGNVQADPAADALAKLNELSRQAERTTEAMHSAQLDLDNKLAAQTAAEAKQSADQAAVDTATAELATFQSSVDKFAAAQYMGGRTSGMDAMLTADSPQRLIDQLSVQRVMASEMRVQMNSYRTVSDQAAKAREASAKSAAEAKTAAEQAAAVRADLQSKQSQLQIQMAVVKSQFEALTPGQREALAAVPPPPPLPEAAGPAPQDPAIVAAPPEGGIPPGDVAPPDGAVAPEVPGGTGEGMMAVQAALTRIGSPYSWGGSGPNQFDCSGLVMWAFQQAGISLPHSSQALARGGQPVDTSQMQPGDVVNYYSDASHSAIYIGDGMMVHASTYGTPVRVAPVNNAPIYNVRRY
ncbi:MAG: peptidoglycan DL-endopeptidase CwlO [Mycobacterium sp.]|nr:peptidoglycan DL-endopeptidase CwlO [Mycobacterium sp.]